MLQLLRATNGQLSSEPPVWAHSAGPEADLVARYQQQCRLVRKALDGDLVKVTPP